MLMESIPNLNLILSSQTVITVDRFKAYNYSKKVQSCFTILTFKKIMKKKVKY